jgi:hypothetical protein
MLETLMGKLDRREREHRADALDQARVAIDRTVAVGGIPTDGRYPAGKSYPQPPRTDHRRVDLEVWAGRAFVKDGNDSGAPKEVPHGTRPQS